MLKICEQPINHIFYHEEEQQRHIDKSLKQYQSHSGGFSRFLYNQNLNKMYRKVKVTDEAMRAEIQDVGVTS